MNIPKPKFVNYCSKMAIYNFILPEILAMKMISLVNRQPPTLSPLGHGAGGGCQGAFSGIQTYSRIKLAKPLSLLSLGEEGGVCGWCKFIKSQNMIFCYERNEAE